MDEYALDETKLDELAQNLPKDGIILLRGTLASGKTTLVRAIAKALGSKSEVSSPTFSILNEYDKNIFHYDIYQCKTDGFLRQGLLENLSKDGLHLIEWADEDFAKILDTVGFEYCIVEIEYQDKKRLYKVSYDE